MKIFKVKLRCSCQIRGKSFRAGEIVTLKPEKYSELVSQGYITEVVEELDTENITKSIDQPPSHKMVVLAETKIRVKKRKYKRRVKK